MWKFSWTNFLLCIPITYGGYIIGVLDLLLLLWMAYVDLAMTYIPEEIENYHLHLLHTRLDVFLLLIVMIASDIILLCGMYKRNHFMLLPWLTTYTIFLIERILSNTMIAVKYGMAISYVEYALMYSMDLMGVYAIFILIILYRMFAVEYHLRLAAYRSTFDTESILSEIVISDHYTLP